VLILCDLTPLSSSSATLAYSLNIDVKNVKKRGFYEKNKKR